MSVALAVHAPCSQSVVAVVDDDEDEELDGSHLCSGSSSAIIQAR